MKQNDIRVVQRNYFKMFKNSIKVMTMILLAGLVVFSACKKDDEEEEVPIRDYTIDDIRIGFEGIDASTPFLSTIGLKKTVCDCWFG